MNRCGRFTWHLLVRCGRSLVNFMVLDGRFSCGEFRTLLCLGLAGEKQERGAMTTSPLLCRGNLTHCVCVCCEIVFFSCLRCMI